VQPHDEGHVCSALECLSVRLRRNCASSIDLGDFADMKQVSEGARRMLEGDIPLAVVLLKIDTAQG
jgi:hypothetical protein